MKLVIITVLLATIILNSIIIIFQLDEITTQMKDIKYMMSAAKCERNTP